MTSFKDREKGFENKFAHDETLRFKAEMRRNKALGQWAGKLLGLSGEALETYTKQVMTSDLQEAGDQDVFRKVRKDFDDNKITVSDDELRQTMEKLFAQAQEEINKN